MVALKYNFMERKITLQKRMAATWGLKKQMIGSGFINRDFSYCGGYGCPLTSMCKRFDMRAFDKNNHPLFWVTTQYNPRTKKCNNFCRR